MSSKIRFVLILETIEQVAAALRFAKTLNVEVDAEGIESPPQLALPAPRPSGQPRKPRGKNKKKSRMNLRFTFTDTELSPKTADATKKALAAARKHFGDSTFTRTELAEVIVKTKGGNLNAAHVLGTSWWKHGILKRASK